jgi:hypothetical protein
VARVDYEAAWTDLLALIASRPGWGGAKLVAEAAQIAARYRIEEGLLERTLRIYGGRVTLAVSDQSEAPASASGDMSHRGAPVLNRTKSRGGRGDGPFDDDGS